MIICIMTTTSGVKMEVVCSEHVQDCLQIQSWGGGQTYSEDSGLKNVDLRIMDELGIGVLGFEDYYGWIEYWG